MKVLVLYDYPPSAGGLATQGDLLFKGLREIGVDVYPAHFDSAQEKAWYYRWFQPDVVVRIGLLGPHTGSDIAPAAVIAPISPSISKLQHYRSTRRIFPEMVFGRLKPSEEQGSQ